MFFDLAFFPVSQEKSTLEYQNETFMQKPVPFTQDGGLWTTNEGKKKKGRGSRWGVIGNFGQGQTIGVVAQETLTSLSSTPHSALPHQSLFRPDKADQWPRVMVVSSFVWRYSTAHHCDGSTRPEWNRKREARHHSAVRNVLLGGHVVVWGGGRIPREFLSKVSAVGQRGDMVSGAWEWPAWDGFISTPLSCQSKQKELHSSLAYVGLTFPKKKKKTPKFRNQLLSSSAINNKHWVHIYYFYWLLQ